MKQTYRMTLKQKTALIAALSLLVTGILLGYSAFGWYTMSKSVTAVGENLTVEAPSNLEIATSSDGPWSNSVMVDLEDYVPAEAGYDKTTYNFFLMPASSYSGVNGAIWQTGKTIGTIADTPEGIAAAQLGAGTAVQWRTNDKMFAGHYIDVPLYFRAGNAAGNLVLATDSTIIPLDNNTKVAQTARVAFLSTTADAPSFGAAPLVYAQEGTGARSAGGTMEVVSGTNVHALTLEQPAYINADGTSPVLHFNAAPEGEMYVVQALCVRIWVEGQDARCVATIGSKTFSVKLVFVLTES